MSRQRNREPFPSPKIVVEVLHENGEVSESFTAASHLEAEALVRGINIGLNLCSNSCLEAGIRGERREV